MSELRQIEAEAETLDEARAALERLIPDGFHCATEEVLSSGIPQTLRVVGETLDDAYNNGLSTVPVGAEVLEKREVVASREENIEIFEFDEPMAIQEAKKNIPENARVEAIHLKEQGKKGFLGFGRRPHTYTAKINHLPVIEIVYKEKARITATIKPKPSQHELLSSLADLETKTSDQWLRLDQPIQGELVALMVMTGAFRFLKEEVSEPFNILLNDAKLLFPHQTEIQKIGPLNLGPPDRNYDVSDISLVSQQFKEALTSIKQLRVHLENIES